MKTCPFCAEEIQDAAIVCKHCGRDLVPASPTATAAALPTSSPAKYSSLLFWALLVIIAGVVVAFSMLNGSSRRPSSPEQSVPSRVPAEIRVSGDTSTLTFTNDSDNVGWHACSVTIAGGYFLRGFGSLPPRGMATVYFQAFKTNSGVSLTERDGYARSLDLLELDCTDDSGVDRTIRLR